MEKNKLTKTRRSRKRKIPNIAKPDETLWEVERITRVRMWKQDGGDIRAEFHVKWVGHNSLTWEPMESVSMVPLLLEEMETRCRREKEHGMALVTNRSSVPVGNTTGYCPQIPAEFLSRFKHSAEFVPLGTEIVKNIGHETVDRGVLLWSVTFMDKPGYFFVRKCVMEYYFPVESAFFHENMSKKEGGMRRVLKGNK